MYIILCISTTGIPYICIDGGTDFAVIMHLCLYFISLGQGIPNQMARTSRAARVNPVLVPTPDEAVADFHQTGGRLHMISEFGKDPLDGRRDLQQCRYDAFAERFPSLEPIYHQVVNNDSTLFKQSLLYFISITERLSSTIHQN